MTSRQRAAKVKATLPDFDREAYTRGWNASSLEAGDSRREPDEWYQGFLDRANIREKWHLPLCPNHHNDEGGCGLA